MRDIELRVSKVVEYNISLEGLTENEAKQLVQDLEFVQERLPDGLGNVARDLLYYLKTELSKNNPMTTTFPHEGI